jgi:hypothetical protein
VINPQAAQAGIIYTSTNITFTSKVGQPDMVFFDVNHDGINDFVLSDFIQGFTGALLYASGLNGNRVQISPPLSAGAPIGPSGLFSPVEFLAHNYAGITGPWADVTDHYLGLSFNFNGHPYFGWAELTVAAPQNGFYVINGTLEGFAYETVAGKVILAGQTSETSEPNELGLLALGSLGLAYWRRKSLGRPRKATADR